MKEVFDSLSEIDEMDQEIADARRRMSEVEDELSQLTAPVAELEKQVTTVRTQLDETKQRGRTLERAAEAKRDRLKVYEERMSRIRNSREEAAVSTEVDLVRRAAETDETEAIQMMEQATRQELRAEELDTKLSTTLSEVGPQRESLEQERAEAERKLTELESRRRERIEQLDPSTRETYTRIRRSTVRRVLVEITPDGACGNCFSVLPLQRQNEVRRSTALVRCEHCGVVLRPAG